MSTVEFSNPKPPIKRTSPSRGITLADSGTEPKLSQVALTKSLAYLGRPCVEFNNSIHPVEILPGDVEIRNKVKTQRSAMILVDDSGNISWHARWWPHAASLFGIWFDKRFSKLPKGCCQLFYTRPRGCPGFITLNYLLAGPSARYHTGFRALQALRGIANLIDAHAIVCHASNRRFSYKVMQRWGFERHARHLPGHHYIYRLSTNPICNDEHTATNEGTHPTSRI